MQIAWIGTGIMGAPMALRLLRAGHRVTVFNRTRARAQALAGDGAIVADSPIEAVRGAEVVFTMVPDTPDVEQVVAQIAPALEAGRLLIDMSTVAPAGTRRVAERLGSQKVEFLDAPVSGGEPGAIEGTLTIMVGGSREAFGRARPLLDHLGKRITHMGPAGSGQMTKLVNQVAVAVNLEATVEALLLAVRGGLDPALALEAIGAGAAASWQLNNLGPKIIARDYRPGFLIKLLRKDLRLLSEVARETKTPLPGLSLVSTLFDAAAAQGHEADGTQALATVLAAMAAAK
ncbi:MAG TPA: NAD(P)-dependent oxidoreductase [Candidatus Binataceae bacterium]|jgi:3-hydroxyisobutyrate dehydrogenase-like beta-hydroxyacid dehydrogenase|nr:NAD(P)-dependent oxidoreductase [Candidatus Binataceae bacterium]